MEIVYRNTLHSSKQKPFLLFVINGKLHLFSGRAIPGIVSVKERQSFESGATVYTLQLNDSVRVITAAKLNDGCVYNGLNEVLGSKSCTWKDYAVALDVSVHEVMTFIRATWPVTASKIDTNTKVLESIIPQSLFPM
jgi:hypothetical protein